MIHISQNAAKQIQAVKNQENQKGESFLRIRIIGGGCSGLTYKLEFDNQKSDEDKIFNDFDVDVVIDPKSYLHAIGSTLNFSGGLNGKGFTIDNPLAKRSCGCGTSFSLS